MARRAVSITTPLRHSATKGVYSYLVSSIGEVQHRHGDSPSLGFVGRLAKKDGFVREHFVVVENTVETPDLIERVFQALRRGDPTRMLVSFERSAVPDASNGRVAHLQTIARVEAIPEPKNPKALPGQLSLAF